MSGATTSGATMRWLRDRSAWTDEEWDWFMMGPFDGGVPGLIRRIRRILDVSQRGLAAILDVSQSVVARWETGRTSPRTSVLERLLEMARLTITVTDADTDEVVRPMRNDGARDRGGRRFPAHVDLRVTGWWCPRGVEVTPHWMAWLRRSRAKGDPSIRYRHAWWRRVERELYGTPIDHPARHQLLAEADHLDESRALPRAA